MASTKDQTRVSKSQGPLSILFRPVGLILSACCYLFLALAIGILVEWAGMTFYWERNHANEMLSEELNYLGSNFTSSIAGRSPAELATSIAIAVRSFLTENGFVRYLTHTTTGNPANVTLRGVSSLLRGTAAYIEAALFVTLTICVRLTIIVLSSPIIVLVTLITAQDGLVERELRVVGGDREHSRVVHYALYWAPKFAFFAPILYLAWPTVANPVWFFVPAMMAFGITNYILFSQYQKRL